MDQATQTLLQQMADEINELKTQLNNSANKRTLSNLNAIYEKRLKALEDKVTLLETQLNLLRGGR